MKAIALVNRRVILATDAFAEIAIWQVTEPIPPSRHRFKYRLAYVVEQECVLRYDNERGKGDHRHIDLKEEVYHFNTPEQLMRDFANEIARWNDEHGRT